MKRVKYGDSGNVIYVTSDNFPVSYINMPKCACTTIKNYLYYLDNGSWHKDPLEIHKYLSSKKMLLIKSKEEDIIDEFTFTFVRHPLKRAYSAFHEKIVHMGKYSFPKITKYISKKYDVDLSLSSDPKVNEEQLYKFLCFVNDNINDMTDVRKDEHWIPQSMVLQKYNKLRRVDFVGRIEKFEQDFDFVIKKAGIDDLDVGKRFNEGPKPECKLEDVMSKRIEVMSRNVFHQDAVSFGYKVDDIVTG